MKRKREDRKCSQIPRIWIRVTLISFDLIDCTIHTRHSKDKKIKRKNMIDEFNYLNKESVFSDSNKIAGVQDFLEN